MSSLGSARIAWRSASPSFTSCILAQRSREDRANSERVRRILRDLAPERKTLITQILRIFLAGVGAQKSRQTPTENARLLRFLLTSGWSFRGLGSGVARRRFSRRNFLFCRLLWCWILCNWWSSRWLGGLLFALLWCGRGLPHRCGPRWLWSCRRGSCNRRQSRSADVGCACRCRRSHDRRPSLRERFRRQLGPKRFNLLPRARHADIAFERRFPVGTEVRVMNHIRREFFAGRFLVRLPHEQLPNHRLAFQLFRTHLPSEDFALRQIELPRVTIRERDIDEVGHLSERNIGSVNGLVLSPADELRRDHADQRHAADDPVTRSGGVPGQGHLVDGQPTGRLGDQVEYADFDHPFRTDHVIRDLVVYLDVIALDDAIF